MKKIAIIRTDIKALDPQFYNVQEIGLAKGLLNYDISTDIYSRFKNIECVTVIGQLGEGKIRLIPIRGLSILGKMTWHFKLIKSILREKYDAIQVHEESQIMTPFILKASQKGNIRNVLFQGMYEEYKGGKRYLQKIFDFLFLKIEWESVDVVLAKTQAAKQYLINKQFLNVGILPVGLNIEQDSEQFDSIKELEEFKKTHKHLLLYIGQLEPRRNVKFLLKIIDKLKFQKIETGLIIVGNGPDSEIIRAKIDEYNINDYVKIYDHVPNAQLKDIYELSDVFLLPSYYEIYGMVVLEALYHGLPVISSPTAGPSDILLDDELGCCLDMDVNKWVKKIIYYFAEKQSADRRTKYVREKYNWNIIAERYIELVFSK